MEHGDFAIGKEFQTATGVWRCTVNAYVINSRVVWTEARDRLRYARLQAEVLLAEDEQPEPIVADKAALHRLPRIGEMQIPSGSGLPPISQPSFPGMETDLLGTPGKDEE
jgi:hypothetical protein